MFKVIGIANKLLKHKRTQKYHDMYVFVQHFSKSRRTYCWTHATNVNKYANFEFDIKKI